MLAPARRTKQEIWLVLALSYLASGVYALVRIFYDLTLPGGLRRQTEALNPSLAPGRPWFDLIYQLLSIGFALVPVLLILHLLQRDYDNAFDEIGFNFRRPGFDIPWGFGLAALIGIPGLGLYVLGRALGFTVNLVPASLPHIWWGIPVLILSAIQNAVAEETIVVGYLLTRLKELGWGDWPSIFTSAVLRGSYHLYQGVGAFFGNAVMGVVFGYFYKRYGRVMPLVIAHSILDIVSFVGYALVGKHLKFLH
jgi:membrane protease YdiL (CAAX protease family)